jgi:hypothetical protein
MGHLGQVHTCSSTKKPANHPPRPKGNVQWPIGAPRPVIERERKYKTRWSVWSLMVHCAPRRGGSRGGLRLPSGVSVGTEAQERGLENGGPGTHRRVRLDNIQKNIAHFKT